MDQLVQQIRVMSQAQLIAYGMCGKLEKLEHITQDVPWPHIGDSDYESRSKTDIFFHEFRNNKIEVIAEDHRGSSLSTIITMPPRTDPFALSQPVPVTSKGMVKVTLNEFSSHCNQLHPLLKVPRFPCPLPDSVIPYELSQGRAELLARAKTATVSSTNIWDNVLKFAHFPGNILGHNVVMALYGFGTWITPQKTQMTVLPFATWPEAKARGELSGTRLVDWMKDGQPRNYYNEWQVMSCSNVELGEMVYIPPGTAFNITGDFAIAGHELEYSEIVAWSTVLALQLKYPESSAPEINNSEHALEFLRAVNAGIEQAEKAGDVSKFGGADKVQAFRKNRKIREDFLVLGSAAV